MTTNKQRHGRTGRLFRLGTALAGAAGLTLLLARWGHAAWTDLRTLPDNPAMTSGDAIADVAAVLALAAWAWLLLGAVVTVVEALLRPSTHRLAPRLAPAAWRRLVISVVGVGLLGAPAGIAQASPGDSAHLLGSRLAPDRGAPASVVRGLPLPDRPFSRTPATDPPGADRDRAAAPTAPQRVTVRPGDSLWAIAQRHLGPRATDRAIAAEWRRWYAANRACIGPNPDLIHPGMVLHAPTRKAAS